MNGSKIKIAVVGTGPAGLMTATRLAQDSRFEIHVFEKRKAMGRKLLIAGSSGLNISHHADPESFALHYTGWTPDVWSRFLSTFSPPDWLRFIEKELGMETFLGTSERYFVREMKASGLLKRWMEFLEKREVVFHSQHELIDFDSDEAGVTLEFKDSATRMRFHSAAFLLGGASWLKEEGLEPAWAEVFRRKKIELARFEPSNVGYAVDWSPAFLKEAEGKPLKKIRFTSNRGSKLGELVITEYGLEGTPVYFYGARGPAAIDLKPDMTLLQMIDKCTAIRENLSPLRRVKKVLGLNEAAMALLFHHTGDAVKADLKSLVTVIKAFPVILKEPRSLSESISSKGGVALGELTSALELKKYPRIFCGGEMLDWDAPTGGFLIQASVSQGAWIANSIKKVDVSSRVLGVDGCRQDFKASDVLTLIINTNHVLK